MANINKKNFNSPDETANPGDKVKVETVSFGNIKIQKITAGPGWKWSESLKPVLKTETCQKDHLLYMISGTLASQLTGGEVEELTAGDVVNIPPDHDGWTVGNEAAVWLELPH